jgi:Asp/Glu/hydantoin racemase
VFGVWGALGGPEGEVMSEHKHTFPQSYSPLPSAFKKNNAPTQMEITLQTYFTKQALIKMLASDERQVEDARIAACCVGFADALIEALDTE